jgi:hypothetical protein
MATIKPASSSVSIRLGEVARGSVVPFQCRLCHRHRRGVHRRPNLAAAALASWLRPGIRGQTACISEFWRTWSFLTERLEQLHKGGR